MVPTSWSTSSANMGQFLSKAKRLLRKWILFRIWMNSAPLPLSKLAGLKVALASLPSGLVALGGGIQFCRRTITCFRP